VARAARSGRLPRTPQCVDAAEQGIHAGDEVREAQVLCQKIIGAEPQSRDGVELAVAGGEENDGQLG